MAELQENPIITKINALKSRFRNGDSTDQFIVEEWERQAKTALIQANLQEHEGIVMIIDKVSEDLKKIDEVLTTAYSKDLSQEDRDRFLDMKEFYKWFLSFFETAHSQVSDIEESVDNELGDEEGE